MRPEPGTIIEERYRIIRKLGDGGMGSVYEGEHLLIKRRVAIKVLHGNLADRKEVVTRFRREAEAATSIGHPNIIEVTDFGALPDGSPFMVLEYLEGRDFADDIERRGPQPLDKVAHIVSQVCRALSAAHAKGIVHRDLKPENIFLLERGGDANFAKVLDFGVSKIRSVGPDEASEHKLTKTGAAIGTPYYMPPEQCRGLPDIDHRADLYSLGVILFRSLTGQYPFDDQTYPMLVLKICTQPPPDMTLWRSDLPMGVIDLVNGLLEKEPAHRPQSCAEVEAALRPYVSGPGSVGVVQNAPSTADIVARGDAGQVVSAAVPATRSGSFGAPAAPAAPTVRPRPVLPIALLAGAAALFLVSVITGVGVGVTVLMRDSPDGDPTDHRPTDDRRTEAPPGAQTSPPPPVANRASPRVIVWDWHRLSFPVDVDGDGSEDIVGWPDSRTLCAYRGTSGEELFCVPCEAQGHGSLHLATLVEHRVVHIDGRGGVLGFDLSSGEDLGRGGHHGRGSPGGGLHAG